MKTDIHPEYMLATVTCSCGNSFQTRSTKSELHVEICSECHPFYTGKQKLMDTGGRVERFQRRLERAGQPPLTAGKIGDAADGRCADRRPGRARGRDDAQPVRVVGRGAQARRRDRRGEPADPALPAQHRWARIPVVRGVVALGESLAIGFRALAISANYAAQEEGEEGEDVQTELSRGQLFFAFAVAIGFALLLFKVSPALITNWLPVEGNYSFVVVEGLIRVSGLHRLPPHHLHAGPEARVPVPRRRAQGDQRLEAGDELEPELVQRHSLIHVRCGTAFLLYVMVIAIFVFAFVGRLDWYWLIVSRILLLPVIAGLAYEVIRFAGKHPTNPILRTLLAPGLWLQRLTTRAPSLDQIEVSIRALHEVLRLEGRLTPDERKVEVMA